MSSIWNIGFVILLAHAQFTLSHARIMQVSGGTSTVDQTQTPLNAVLSSSSSQSPISTTPQVNTQPLPTPTQMNTFQNIAMSLTSTLGGPIQAVLPQGTLPQGTISQGTLAQGIVPQGSYLQGLNLSSDVTSSSQQMRNMLRTQPAPVNDSVNVGLPPLSLQNIHQQIQYLPPSHQQVSQLSFPNNAQQQMPILNQFSPQQIQITNLSQGLLKNQSQIGLQQATSLPNQLPTQTPTGAPTWASAQTYTPTQTPTPTQTYTPAQTSTPTQPATIPFGLMNLQGMTQSLLTNSQSSSQGSPTVQGNEMGNQQSMLSNLFGGLNLNSITNAGPPSLQNTQGAQGIQGMMQGIPGNQGVQASQGVQNTQGTQVVVPSNQGYENPHQESSLNLQDSGVLSNMLSKFSTSSLGLSFPSQHIQPLQSVPSSPSPSSPSPSSPSPSSPSPSPPSPPLSSPPSSPSNMNFLWQPVAPPSDNLTGAANPSKQTSKKVKCPQVEENNHTYQFYRFYYNCTLECINRDILKAKSLTKNIKDTPSQAQNALLNILLARNNNYNEDFTTLSKVRLTDNLKLMARAKAWNLEKKTTALLRRLQYELDQVPRPKISYNPKVKTEEFNRIKQQYARFKIGLLNLKTQINLAESQKDSDSSLGQQNLSNLKQSGKEMQNQFQQLYTARRASDKLQTADISSLVDIERQIRQLLSSLNGSATSTSNIGSNNIP